MIYLQNNRKTRTHKHEKNTRITAYFMAKQRLEAFKREIRIAPANISFAMGYWFYANKVAFLASRKEGFGFIIESEELVEALKAQFEVVWQISKVLSCKIEDVSEFLRVLDGKEFRK